MAISPVRSRVGMNRRVPTWASALLARLAQDRPAVVTRADVAAYLAEASADRDVDVAVRELQRLGWTAPVHIKGVWAYLPPGEAEVMDPYIDLRAWRAREPEATAALAGEAVAWHLGYLARAFAGPVAVWVPKGERLPHGLRPHISVVTLGWGREVAGLLAPSPALLRRRQLDLTGWASGLPALGPEALVVQLGVRPTSFRAWPDLVPSLDRLANDVDAQALAELLRGKSSSAWQRAAYVLHSGGDYQKARAVLDQRPPGPMPHVTFGDAEVSLWSPEFRVTDRLIAPVQGLISKA
jgi:hypothetical protein